MLAVHRLTCDRRSLVSFILLLSVGFIAILYAVSWHCDWPLPSWYHDGFVYGLRTKRLNVWRWMLIRSTKLKTNLNQDRMNLIAYCGVEYIREWDRVTKWGGERERGSERERYGERERGKERWNFVLLLYLIHLRILHCFFLYYLCCFRFMDSNPRYVCHIALRSFVFISRFILILPLGSNTLLSIDTYTIVDFN